MIGNIAVIITTAALFLAIILTLAAKPAVSGKITGMMLVVSALGGFLIYGYGYAAVTSNSLLAIIRATLAVCGMFVGKNDLGAISAAPMMDQIWMLIVFWLIHLFALYTSASAAIATIGAEALKKIRLALSRRGNLVLIYGLNRDSLSYGEACSKQKGCSVVFVAPAADAGTATAIGKMGAVLRTDKQALHPTKSFLSSLGIRPGKRQISVCCMGSEPANYGFASELKTALEAAGVNPEQTSLVIFGSEDSFAGRLQVYQDVYGYGCVSVFQRHDQAARLLVRQCPPWETISFREDGSAEEDFEALVIGFGICGQSVFKELIRSGQFCGSHFRATVIDPQCHSGAGYLHFRCPEIFTQYDVRMIEADGRSEETFRFLQKHKDTLKYVVVSIGNEKINQEVTDYVTHYLFTEGKDIPVVQCTLSGVTVYRKNTMAAQSFPLVSPETMNFTETDHIAMGINHRYCSDPTHSLWDDWRDCDYFSRMSSRAFGDFLPAFLRMLHMSQEDAAQLEELSLTPEQTEILGQNEHLRWCAFHHTMGFSAMSEEEWNERARQYQYEMKELGRSSIRIGKNMSERRHACLIPWEELPELSQREKKITGKDPRYQQLDINNVLEIPTLLRMK